MREATHDRSDRPAGDVISRSLRPYPPRARSDGDEPRELHYVHSHHPSCGPEGPRPQQDAHRPHHARHDHRRVRRHHDGGAGQRRAAADRRAGHGRPAPISSPSGRELPTGRDQPGDGGRPDPEGAGRREDPRAGPRGRLSRGVGQHARPGRGGWRELVGADRGHRRRVSADPILGPRVRRLLHHDARPVRGQGGRPGIGRARQPLRRGDRPGRPADPHTQPVVPGDRGDGVEGGRTVRSGPGRHDPGRPTRRSRRSSADATARTSPGSRSPPSHPTTSA